MSIFLESRDDDPSISASRSRDSYGAPAPYHSSRADSSFTTRDRDVIDSNRGERDTRRNSDDMIFLIPKETVGAVIGKGGHVLKDLYAEFGFRVRVERDDVGSSRNVVISAPNQGPLTSQELINMQRCRDKILKIVETSLENTESQGRAVEDV